MENVNLLPENEYTEVEGRKYLNPNLSVERTNEFIDNLRSTQQANNQQIATDTQRLGTDVSSGLGGLTGAGSYFTSRYQTPQTNLVVQNLRAAAQADALNQAMQNEQEMWKKRYQDAYRAYQKRANSSGSGGSGGNGGNGDNTSTWQGGTKKNATGGHYVYWLGQDGNVWVNQNGTTKNIGQAVMENGQWNGKAEGSLGSMDGDGTKIDDPNPGGGGTPPDVKNYTKDIDEKYRKLPAGWRYIIERATGGGTQTT